MSVIPKSVDLRDNLPPIFDQQGLQSCTAHATFVAYQYLNPGFSGSRMFQFYNTRKIQYGFVFGDVGATINAATQSLITYGICDEPLFPYNTNNVLSLPPAPCYTAASANKIKSRSLININLTEMQKKLANGFPLIIVIPIYSSFMSVKSNGIVKMPTATDGYIGGHAVTIVGYTQTYWIVRNSWGIKWGDNGYCYFPISYLADPKLKLCWEIWTIDKLE